MIKPAAGGRRSLRDVLRPISVSARQAGFTTGVMVALVALIVAASAIFASARSSVEVAGLGSQGIYDEAALSAAATTRNRASQAYIIDTAYQLGIAERSDVDEAMTATADGMAELDIRVERLAGRLSDPADVARLRQLTDDFQASIAALQSKLGGGEEPTQSDLEAIDDDYQALASSLVADRDMVVNELQLAQEDAGRIADAARFMVAFAIPLVAIYLFRRSVRRRQRQHLLEQELDRQREIAATKDDFIADLSHELRTPLTSIYGFATALLDPEMSDDHSSTREFAGLIAGEADELARMVDDLLTAARADDNALHFLREEVDPVEEIESVLAPLRKLGVEVVTKTAPGHVQADHLRLRQVLRNLVSNALKHGSPPVGVVGRKVSGVYSIAVSDSGPGVPEELEAKLFQRFIHEGRAPLLTGSVGLGLSIAKLLIEGMGGTIRYQRTDGITNFIVELPLWVDEETHPVDAASSDPALVPTTFETA